ncbi:MAG: hypothetical protein CK429_17460 [Mycobacterium sp.]|uniref:Uncharacterized protein n=1 Tax=Mycobacterium gordonae TaxID=1778 RepID=A0A1A6BBJ9_MYCGO|nr:hypothetical protein A9W98_28735 [Mycobacterium gordonae]ODR21912.1 hypothetical protein BHQ23_10755 [Mycobacterium gordonae]ORV94466.1 hypothetical protein AWC08_16525 [Mycobacterium gordonae]PJE08587.1 MAG: hypothetical protein CK428_19800 [Mycobacterium sp.]PJE11316.1 MAG: hypothetical protein CK429_17460 [Mycobacterium sp.]
MAALRYPRCYALIKGSLWRPAKCEDLPVGRRRFEDTVAKIALLCGICAGGAAAVIALAPASALWTGFFVCGSGQQLAYGTARMTDRSWRTNTRVTFQCIGDGGGVDADLFTIYVLQAVLVAFVLGALLAAVRLGYRWRDGR